MKCTNSEIIHCGLSTTQDGEKQHDCVLYFQMHTEDMQLARRVIEWLNEKHLAPEMDMADFFLTCITLQIHKQVESMTGEPFTLRMDRKEKKA